MSDAIKNLFTKAALVTALGATSVGANAEVQPTAAPASSPPTTRVHSAEAIAQAKETLQTSNEATKKLHDFADNFASIKKADCENTVKSQQDIANIQTYLGAQAVLIDVGQLPLSDAKREWKDHTASLKDTKSKWGELTNNCGALGVNLGPAL